MEESAIDFRDGTMFIPGFCEILPISMSTKEHITWLGKERKKKEVTE
jgi:hypothetical protein